MYPITLANLFFSSGKLWRFLMIFYINNYVLYKKSRSSSNMLKKFKTGLFNFHSVFMLNCHNCDCLRLSISIHGITQQIALAGVAQWSSILPGTKRVPLIPSQGTRQVADSLSRIDVSPFPTHSFLLSLWNKQLKKHTE